MQAGDTTDKENGKHKTETTPKANRQATNKATTGPKAHRSGVASLHPATLALSGGPTDALQGSGPDKEHGLEERQW